MPPIPATLERKVYGPNRILPTRPPRSMQVVRNPKPDLTLAEIDWSRWYLTEEEDMGETTHHAEISRTFVGLLRNWLVERGEKRSYVNGNTLFQWVEEHPQVQISPDAYLVDRVPHPPPGTFQLWRAGHLPPRFALEVVSEDWHKDYDDGPPKYAQLGCQELVIYDPEHDQHRRSKERVALQLYRRTRDGIFMRAYFGDGPVFCESLGAWLVAVPGPDCNLLRLARDAAGLDWVATAEEQAVAAQEQAVAAKEQAAAAQVQASAAQEQATAAQEQALAAKEQAAAAQEQAVAAQEQLAAAQEQAVAAQEQAAAAHTERDAERIARQAADAEIAALRAELTRVARGVG